MITDVAQLALTDDTTLIPVIAQHAHTGEVLMLAYANRESIQRTLAERVMVYYSRSRREIWRKGDTSGNAQHLVSLHADCDGDALVARVLPAGPSCHTGSWSCFNAPPTLAAVSDVIDARAAQPDAASYTTRLLGDENLRLKKLGEEAVELAIACSRGDSAGVREEAADLLYHTLVACRGTGVAFDDVLAVLETRRGVSAASSSSGEAGGTAAGG